MSQSPFHKDIFFQNNSLPTIIIDEQLKIVDANKTIINLLGYKKEDILGKAIQSLTDNRYFTVSTGNTSKLLNGEITTYTVIRKYKDVKGKLKSFEVEVSLIEDTINSKKYFSGHFKRLDLSKVGNIFNLDKAKINTLIKNSPFMFYVHDIENNTNTYENINLLSYLGYNNRDLKDKSELEFLDSLLDKEQYQSLKTKLDKFKYSNKSSEILEIEYLTINKKNEPVWIFDRSVILKKDADGKRLYSYGIILDITQRKKDEQQIKTQQELLERVSLSIPEFIYIMGVNSQRVLFSNKKSKEILGYSEREFNNIIREEILHPNHYIEYVNQIDEFINSKKAKQHSITTKLKHKTKGYIWCEVNTFVFEKDDKGNTTKILKTLKNIDKKTKEKIINTEKDQFIKDVTSKLPSTIYVRDIQTDNLIFTNVEKKNNLGYNNKEWELGFKTIIHKDHFKNYKEKRKALFFQKNDNSLSFDILLKNKSKTYKWYNLKMKIFKRDKFNEPQQLLEIYEDVHDKQVQISKINEQQELIETITSSISPYMYLYNYNIKEFTYTNFEDRKIFGYNKDEYLKNSLSFVHPNHKEEIKRFTNNIFFKEIKNSKFETEIQLKNKKGDYVWINLKIIVIKRDKKGIPTEVLEISENIDEFKKKAIQISTQQNLIETITNSIGPYMYLYNTKLKEFTYTNFEDRTIFGYSKEEYLKDSHGFTHPNNLFEINELIKEINSNSNENNHELELLLRHKNQEYKWANLKIIVISRDEFGVPEQLLEIVSDINDSKKKAIKISEQQNLIEKISTSIPDFIYLKNYHNEQLIFSNNKCSEVLGYNDKEFVSSEKIHLIHPDHIFKLSKYNEKILTTKNIRNFSIDVLIKHKTLGYRWYRNKSIIFERDRNLEPTKILELVSDIHETKMNNQRIVDQQKFIENISSTIPQYLSVYDLSTKKCLYTNYDVKPIFGYSRKEYLILGNSLIHPKQRTKSVELANKMITSDRSNLTSGIEFLIKHKTRGYIWVKLKILITKRNKNGIGTQALEIIEDIDKSKKAFNQILDQQNFIQKVASTVPSIIQVTDIKANKVIYSNFEKRTFLEYNKSNWEKTGLRIINPLHHEIYKNDILNLLHNEPNSVKTHEIQIKDGLGNYKWVLVINRSFKIEEGKGVQLMTVFRDINNKKELQINLEQQLSKNIELERFASITSHDLKEPLRTLGNYAQILSLEYKNQLDESANELLDYITDSTKRMDDLINDILDFAKVNTDAKKFEKVKLNEVVSAVLKDLEEQISDRSAKIKISNLPKILGDKTQLRQVFQNLISNAIKFTKERIPEINIAVSKNNTKWTLAITDNGIGINPKQQKDIFGIFQKLHRENEYEGQGIGLSICKRIIERHDGEIWLESKEGEGTTFFFTLPIVKF